MALQAIESPLKNLCRQLGLGADLSLIEQAWNAEMGGWELMARVVALNQGALVVEVTSAPAMQEITLRRRELVRRLNRHFSHPLIRNLLIRMEGTNGS